LGQGAELVAPQNRQDGNRDLVLLPCQPLFFNQGAAK
jgi:hypothetical protein